MSDPAIEAAQRARGVETLHPAHLMADEIALAAAREALKPVRACYARWAAIYGGARGDVAEMVQILLEELAPLIYSTEELS